MYVGGPTCKEESHPIKQIKRKKDSAYCELCGKDIRRDSWGCVEHDYDVCLTCFEKN